ncbi:RNA polymerase sigma factor [Kribbella sp. CA-253562]|uniref:RNA polymerase sigma factor n=1 Tax=Kribbella sp. CA-253562 TaxID=3239942 RepID=UPI003D9248AC
MDPGFRASVRSGDEDAFRELFQLHNRAVYNFCFRATGDWSAAEDCMSLVFLEAWRLKAKVDGEGGSLLPWLLGIATFVLRRRHRVARRHQLLMERMPAPAVVPDFTDEALGRIEDQERIEAIRRVLDTLPRADREVLWLCVWAGLGYAAAAEALGVPVGTVRSRLSRARRRLDKLARADLQAIREPPSLDWQISDDRTEAVPSTERTSR